MITKLGESSDFILFTVHGVFGDESISLSSGTGTIVICVGVKLSINELKIFDVSVSFSCSVEDTEVSIEKWVENSISVVDSLGKSGFFKVSEVPQRVLSISIATGSKSNEGFFAEPANLGIDTTVSVTRGGVLELLSTNIGDTEMFVSPTRSYSVVIESPFKS